MTANYHTHTKRCRHAVGEDREYVECAIAGGLKVLGFSDHCPWVFEDGYESGVRMLPRELDGYFKSLSDLKMEYASDIKIYIGLEAEYIPELIEGQNALLKDYPLDYMIMGEHFLESESHSAYTGSKTDDADFLERYVNTIIEGMETGKYRYLAHPDLFNFVGSPDIYEKQFTRLCVYLKNHDIPVEINLLGLSDKRHYPSDRFLKIARKVGNSAIIGCDAHRPEVLSSKNEQEACLALAKKYDLKVLEYLDGLN